MALSLQDECVSTQDVLVESFTAQDNAEIVALINEYLERVDHQLLDIKWAASGHWVEALIIMRRV